MTAKRLGARVTAALGLVGIVCFVDSSGLLSTDAEVVVDDSAQLVAGIFAAGACWWTARQVTGPARTWRTLMGFGAAGWSVGMAFWAYYQIFSHTPLPSPSIADVGYLTLPVFALPALLALAIEPRVHPVRALRRASVVFFLDGLIVVGSLFILTWSTSLGSVVKAGAPTSLALAVAIAYPVTDLILVVIVVLLAVTRRVSEQYRTELWLLGGGLIGLSVSDSIFAYLVSSGADEMPPLTNAGFIAGPLLIGLAALATAETPYRAAHLQGHTRAHRRVERGHLLLPYLLVALTGVLVAVQMSLGHQIDAVEASAAWIVLVLVLARQVNTLLENTALLERVSATQAELAYRAQHDPLTGLPNRALFGERLMAAIDRHRQLGRSFALLLVDLDDFKAINDNLGHAVGDQLLHAVGERLRGCVRAMDTVARLGGDEFAVVLEGTAEMPGLVCQRILAALREPFQVDGHLLSLGASLGVVEPRQGELDLTADMVLRRADGAMYVGKQRGKGIAVHYCPELVGEHGSLDAAVSGVEAPQRSWPSSPIPPG